MSAEHLTGLVSDEQVAKELIATSRAHAEQAAFDQLESWAEERFRDIEADLHNYILPTEPNWGANLTQQRPARTPKPATITSKILPTYTDSEGAVDVVLGMYDDARRAVTTAKHVAEEVGVTPRKAVASLVAAASLVGIGMQTQDHDTTIQRPVVEGLRISRTTTNTLVELGDTAGQAEEPSKQAVARVINVAPEDQKVANDALVLPKDISDEQAVTAAIAYLAPDTTPKTEKAEAPKTPEIAPAVQALNDALEKIDMHTETIDISAVRDAVIQMDAWYAPQDKDRMANMPAGYVKVLLPSEAVGLSVPMTVAERTADVERYTSPTMAAVDYVSAKILQQIIAEKYPDQKGAMWRLRDHQAPAHLTHNDGRTADISSSMGYEVTQYSDGPFADFQFSEDFNKALTEDMFAQMSRYSDADGPVISSILSSGESMAQDVNGLVGRNFIQRKSDHQDHGHVTLKDRFTMTQWRPRAGDLPWSVDQDLRIAGMAQPISPEQHASQHADFEATIGEQHAPENHSEPAKETTENTEQKTAVSPEVLSHQAELLIDQLDLSQDRKEFLKRMLPSITAISQSGAKINPEVVLAQTTLETGFGHDSLSGITNNYFGIKAGKNWQGKVYVADAKEEYQAGDVVNIRDGFRVYDNPAESVADYAKLIENAPHYADAVRNYRDPSGYVNGLFNEVDDNGHIVREQGSEGVLSYGTDRGYEQKVLEVIDKYNYAQLVKAQIENTKASSPSTESTTTTTVAPEDKQSTSSSTTSEPTAEVVSEKLITDDLYVDEATARHIYEGYFKDDEAGLTAWIQGLPQTQGDQGIKYGVNVKNTPDKVKQGEK